MHLLTSKAGAFSFQTIYLPFAMRYFSEIAYNGANFHGWQKQDNAASVQEVIEQAFSTILGAKTEITGCGRTDSGVHASQYFLHFDFEGVFPKEFLKRINKFLPKDIVVKEIFPVNENAHARFDATYRSYIYHIVLDKNPFETDLAWYFPFFENLNFGKMKQAASLLLAYSAFQPFCKSHTDAKTMNCHMYQSKWILDEQSRKLSYHISADRFLRGMVRLIVGMCLNVGLEKLTLDEVRDVMDRQVLLKRSWSVPPQGLFLTEVQYDWKKIKI